MRYCKFEVCSLMINNNSIIKCQTTFQKCIISKQFKVSDNIFFVLVFKNMYLKNVRLVKIKMVQEKLWLLSYIHCNWNVCQKVLKSICFQCSLQIYSSSYRVQISELTRKFLVVFSTMYFYFFFLKNISFRKGGLQREGETDLSSLDSLPKCLLPLELRQESKLLPGLLHRQKGPRTQTILYWFLRSLAGSWITSRTTQAQGGAHL